MKLLYSPSQSHRSGLLFQQNGKPFRDSARFNSEWAQTLKKRVNGRTFLLDFYRTMHLWSDESYKHYFYFSHQPVLDLAECLTKLGFANVSGQPVDVEHDKKLQKYFQNLVNLQNKAKRSRAGLWAEKWVWNDFFAKFFSEVLIWMQ